MRIVVKTIKWIFLGVVGLLVLTVAAGLVTKVMTPKPEPTGTLYDIGGFSLHLDCRGEVRDDRPTLIIESGGGTPAFAYYWLVEKLQEDTQICSYDRAGLGYSDSPVTSRDADTVSHELHALLGAAGIEPPFVLAGHSLGGAYIRVFADNYPEEVAGLIFIDSSHPEQIERWELPDMKPPMIMRLAPYLADVGLLSLVLKLGGPAVIPEGLPPSVVERYNAMLSSGKAMRGGMAEIEAIDEIFSRTSATGDVGSRPVIVFTAGDLGDPEAMRVRGIDPDRFGQIGLELHGELAALSSHGRHITIEKGNHFTLFTIEEYADIMVEEIRALLETMPSRIDEDAVADDAAAHDES